MEEVEEKLMTPKKFSIAIEKTVKELVELIWMHY